MRDLTEDEIEEYLEFVHNDQRHPPEFNQEQGQLIGDAFIRTGMMRAAQVAIAERIMKLPPEQIYAGDLMLSLLVWSFQLGRECESRLLILALKKTKVRTQ